MNCLILVALCCAVVGVSAQKLAWLPVMQPYACVWCSGRYYRRSPQALTTGRPAVGSPANIATSSDIALHAGWFYDIIPKYPVQDEKSACIYLVNMYRGNKGPVEADQIMTYVNMSFFGPQQTKDYSDKPHPLTFQCCHYKYGQQLMDQLVTEEAVATTENPVATTEDVVSTTGVDIAGPSASRKVLRARSAVIPKNRAQIKNAKRDGEEDVEEVVQNSRQKRQAAKGPLKNRNSLRVPGTLADSDIVVVDGADKYKASMPDILPEGFTCDTLTRQLYMELSQDNVVRQKQIQKAMQRSSRRAQNQN